MNIKIIFQALKVFAVSFFFPLVLLSCIAKNANSNKMNTLHTADSYVNFLLFF